MPSTVGECGATKPRRQPVRHTATGGDTDQQSDYSSRTRPSLDAWFVPVPRTRAVRTAGNEGVSSRHLRAEYTGRINRIGLGSVFWSRSYFAGSGGGAPLSAVRHYIEGQKRPT